MHSRLEHYLQTVEQNLSALPAEERDNELHEIRMHMESLVEANKELGSTEEEAVTHTLAQFGRAQRIGKDLTRVHAREEKPTLRTLAGVIAFNYFAGMLASLVMSGLILLTTSPSAGPSTWWILRGMSTTLVVGWLTGAVMPRHAVKGTLYAHLLGAVLSTFLTLIVPDGVILMRSTSIFWTALLVNTIVATLLAMFGARQGAKWSNARRQAMRLAR